MHAVNQLRRLCLASSSREFKARGSVLKRCEYCLLGLQTCICSWRISTESPIEFVLIMHRDEVYKPTNTGRLLADLFPQQCHAFLWQRTEIDQKLLEIINDPNRQCVLVFPPSTTTHTMSKSEFRQSIDGKTPTLILLDGTWKQASKMAAQGKWLNDIPRIDLTDLLSQPNRQECGNYLLRHSGDEQRLSTAEAAALAVEALGARHVCERILDYFAVFNEHYASTRFNRKPNFLPAHRRLQQLKEQLNQ